VLVEEIEEIEEEYFELAKSPVINIFEPTSKEPESKFTKYQFQPIDIKERINLLEMKIDEIEKTLVLLNNNFNERIEVLENRERAHGEVINELSSLKSLVEKTVNVNEELKAKMPTYLRELENKVDITNKKLKEIEEEYAGKPVILE